MESATAVLHTPSGPLLIDATATGIRAIKFSDGCDSGSGVARELAQRAATEIAEYLRGERREFTVPILVPEGETFRAQAQRALAQIPYGSVWTYGELAGFLGNPKAARAVGTACASNPIPILLPCHRVVRAGQGIGNYLGGSAFKQMLLDVEGYTD